MFRRLLLILTLIAVAPFAHAGPNLQGLLQMLDYMAVDYGAAVEDGQIVHQGEYEEMADFSRAVANQIGQLAESDAKAGLQQQAQSLMTLIDGKGDAATLASTAAAMREQIVSHYDIVTVPRKPPELAEAAALYQEQCASCHGVHGMGDGPAGVGMEPAPIDFTDVARASQRSLFGLFNTITLGVEDTDMNGFPQLSDQQRWSLAFYVGAMAWPNADVDTQIQHFTLTEAAVLSPNQAVTRFGSDILEEFVALRHEPASLFAKKGEAIAFARDHMALSLAAYEVGNTELAYKEAITAYLEGFELVEATLDVAAPDLRRAIEKAMTDFRVHIRNGMGLEEIRSAAGDIDRLLQDAEIRMNERALTGGEAFTGALVILLREGLEAILVVAALAAFLVKTGRRDAMKFLHAGWILALVGGVGTWWASNHLIAIGGASREITEGVAALIAATVLFYVGFWLHSKAQSHKWKQFIETSINRALSRSTLWSLAGLSFIAVYREVFETILFFQALWVQTDSSGQQSVLVGSLVGSAILLVLAFVIVRTSKRLPLRQFFGATGILMFALAIIFAGKGVAALQEAGTIPMDPIGFVPSIDLLGLYPNLESFGVQVLMLIAGMVLFWMQRERPQAVR